MQNFSLLPLVAGAAATALMAFSTPALATGPLTLNGFCDQTAGGSWGSFDCTISWSGGSGAVTATFAPASPYTSVGVDSMSTNSAYLSGTCVIGHPAAVRATVTDSANSSVTKTFTATCYYYVP